MSRQPCRSCPWRRENTASMIPRFSLALAEGLAGTCPDERGMGPEFGASLMACHYSGETQEESFACAGWLKQVGTAHPNVRLMLLRGTLSPDAVEPDDVLLHHAWPEVIQKLRETTTEEDRHGR